MNSKNQIAHWIHQCGTRITWHRIDSVTVDCLFDQIYLTITDLLSKILIASKSCQAEILT